MLQLNESWLFYAKELRAKVVKNSRPQWARVLLSKLHDHT